jgi:hypothetical protein
MPEMQVPGGPGGGMGIEVHTAAAVVVDHQAPDVHPDDHQASTVLSAPSGPWRSRRPRFCFCAIESLVGCRMPI